MSQSILLSCFLSVSLFSPAVGTVATYRPQDELKAKVSKAVGLFPKEAENSRKQLISFGQSAVPFVVEIIQSDVNLDPIKKAFLIDVIASIHGEKSDTALLSLFSDRDSFVRGLAATYLGKRKIVAAIPQLVKLLNDKAVYKTIVQTDPAVEHDVLVRDVAIEALQTTTGIVLAQRATKDDQAKAWLRWWKKQQRSKRSC